MPTSSSAHGNRTHKKKSKAGTTVKAGKQLQMKLSTLCVGNLQKITEEQEEQTKVGTPKSTTICQKIVFCASDKSSQHQEQAADNSHFNTNNTSKNNQDEKETMSPSATKWTVDQMQQLQQKKANYGKEIKVTLEDTQEETKEGMIAEEYQYAQKENITTEE
eukprot:2018274-Ditylum_brightwellii.AAC.1